MATELKSPVDVDLSTSQRSLLLVWQSPASRRFVKVGRLDLQVPQVQQPHQPNRERPLLAA